jgi:hypothetical protein
LVAAIRLFLILPSVLWHNYSYEVVTGRFEDFWGGLEGVSFFLGRMDHIGLYLDESPDVPLAKIARGLLAVDTI